jgi:hypothetical protein
VADKTVGIGGIGTKGSYHLDSGDKEMSLKHRHDTIEYNLKHAEDHLQKAREAREQLEKAGQPSRPPSKALLDLFDYFEKEDTPQQKADKHLKNHIKEKY